MSSKGIISVEEERVCELCGVIAETRPYGPNGERVCFKCGMKDEDSVKRGFNKYVLGMGNA